MEQLNRLAAQLLQSQQGFQQASAQMALQEYLRRLQQLARQQQALNQQTQQAGGGQPMPMPGQQPGAGEQLAAQQGGIRQALQQLLGQAGGKSGLGQQLGGLPAEMDDVEEQLRRQQITERTRQQQAQILHKMLDAQRSLYEKEKESRERLAEAPRPYRQPASPPALHPVPVPPATVQASGTPRDLPLGYEGLARQYFEALAKTGL